MYSTETLSLILAAMTGILMVTAFVKLFTALTILRVGLGLTQTGMGLVFFALSLVLSLFLIEPHATVQDLSTVLVSNEESVNQQHFDETFTPFLRKHTDDAVLSRFEELHNTLDLARTREADVVSLPVADSLRTDSLSSETSSEGIKTNHQVKQRAQSRYVLVAAFLVSELKSAFEVGLYILIPFVLLELVLLNVLMLLGVPDFDIRFLSFPLKLLLFYSVDGWRLVVEKLLSGYLT